MHDYTLFSDMASWPLSCFLVAPDMGVRTREATSMTTICPDKRAEQALLANLANQIPQAQARLYEQYGRIVALCVRRVVRRYNVRLAEHDIEDLIAEVWVALLANDCRRIRAFDSSRGYRLSTWIGQIVTNHTIDQLRRRRCDRSLDEIDPFQQLAVSHPTPHDLLEQRQAWELAYRALAVMKEDDRQFLIASFHDDRPPAEMARDLGISVNTVYSRRFKVRAKLGRLAARLAAVPTQLTGEPLVA
jgi:RNA polymerase sigma-70 factor (ECF subfamily)